MFTLSVPIALLRSTARHPPIDFFRRARLVTFFFVHTLVNVHVECSGRIAEVDGEASTDWLLQASTLSHFFLRTHSRECSR